MQKQEANKSCQLITIKLTGRIYFTILTCKDQGLFYFFVSDRELMGVRRGEVIWAVMSEKHFSGKISKIEQESS